MEYVIVCAGCHQAIKEKDLKYDEKLDTFYCPICDCIDFSFQSNPVEENLEANWIKQVIKSFSVFIISCILFIINSLFIGSLLVPINIELRILVIICCLILIFSFLGLLVTLKKFLYYIFPIHKEIKKRKHESRTGRI